MWMGGIQASRCPALWSEFGQVTNREPVTQVQPLSLGVAWKALGKLPLLCAEMAGSCQTWLPGTALHTVCSCRGPGPLPEACSSWRRVGP